MILVALFAGCPAPAAPEPGDRGHDADEDGFSPHDGDCDDHDASVNPGAVDAPADGVDQNCDGWQPPSDPWSPLSASPHATTGWKRPLGEGYGLSVGDWSGSGKAGVALGASPWGTSEGGSAGRPMLIFDKLPSVLDDGTVQIDLVPSGEAFGSYLATTDDLTGDGIDDLLLTQNGQGREGVGGEFSTFFVLSSPLSAPDPMAAPVRVCADGITIGNAAGSGPDLTGDGVVDLVVGGVIGSNIAGHLYVFDHPAGDLDLDDACSTLKGEEIWDQAGSAYRRVPDTDGDGRDELAVGANNWGDAIGRVYLLSEAPPGTSSLGDSPVVLTGDGPVDFGHDLAGTDANGDGYGDLLVSAVFDPTGGAHAGAAYLFLGPLPSTGGPADAAAAFHGDQAGLWAGEGLADLADPDGDGARAFAISAPGDPYFGALTPGRVWIFDDPAIGGELGDDQASALYYGETAYDGAGWKLASGDFGGDGVVDLVITAPWTETVYIVPYNGF